MEKSNVIAVRDFLNYNTTAKPVDLPEMRIFWGVCSEQEKVEFADYSRAQLKAAGVEGY